MKLPSFLRRLKKEIEVVTKKKEIQNFQDGLIVPEEEATAEIEVSAAEESEELPVTEEMETAEEEEETYQELTDSTIAIDSVKEVDVSVTDSAALILEGSEDAEDDEYEYVTPRYGLNGFLLAMGCALAGAAIVFLACRATVAESIKTAYLEQGYILTKDAFAASMDIADGKTAYVNGQLVIGTLVDLDTSNATATDADILAGFTAYVNNEKIVGKIPTFTPNETYVPATKDIVIPKGYYISADIIVSGEPNYTKAQIEAIVKKGVQIYDFTGGFVE